MILRRPKLFALKKYELKTVSDPQAYRWKCKLGDLTLMTVGQAGVAGIDHQDEGVQLDLASGNYLGVGQQLGLDVGD